MVDPSPYPPIADYALLADCHSAALVSRSASIDWACLRRFDAPSVFGRLLDWERGGHFGLNPVGASEYTRTYLEDSLVLETTVATDGGRVRILDAFAMRAGGSSEPRYELVRIVEGLDGEVAVDVCIEPRFDYGLLRPWLRRDQQTGAFTAVGGASALVIASDVHLDVDQQGLHVAGRATLGPGRRARFVTRAQPPHQLDPGAVDAADADAHLDETLEWWRRWSSATTAPGPRPEAVRRSAVVLKGLTCAPTGAIVAAPTSSLPEQIGGERNWDYRYCWIRDATLTLSALCVAGHAEVARGFRDFLLRSAAGSAEDLLIMYGIYGSRHLPEVELALNGYRDSRPVRTGNGAAHQLQHDVYGHILDASYLWRQVFDEVSAAEWRFLHQLVDAAIAARHEPDHGLWEMRGEPQHFTHSKVMLWVAVDRGVRTAEATGRDADLATWRAARDELRSSIETHGVHSEHGHFTQHYGTDEVDASLLVLPLLGFVEADDERMVATVEAVREQLAVGSDGFLLRYRTTSGTDGLEGGEGVFLICSFWLVQVLALQHRLDEAGDLFDRLLGVSNDLGLFAEEYDPHDDQLLGNFPQAFTHLALIEAAYQLECADREPHALAERPWTGSHHLGQRLAPDPGQPAQRPTQHQ